MKLVSLNIILLLFTFQVNSQVVSSIKIERDSIRIGEQILLEFNAEIKSIKESDYILPDIEDILPESIELIKKSKINIKKDSQNKGVSLIRQRYIITSFEEGYQKIPEFGIKFKDSIYQSNLLYLHVSTVKIDTSKGIYDLMPIFEVDYTIKDQIKDVVDNYWPYILGVFGILVLIILFILLKNLTKKEEIIAPPPIIPAHISALAVLTDLKKEEAWTFEDKKKYYSNVIDTLREYLENRFDITALEKTTDEIISDLKFSDIIDSDKVFLKSILQETDLVKFAKYKPSNSDGEAVLLKSIEFVEKTKILKEIIDNE